MGIQGLFKLINDNAADAVVKKPLVDYKDQHIAIDAVLAIYQWCSVGAYRNIKNKSGKYINHIQGLFFRTIALLEAGITPIYVFDGKSPDAKAHTIAARKAILGRVKVPSEVYSECRKLLELMGIPKVESPSEAEAQAAIMTQLTIDGKPIADAVSTEDGDALVFGAVKLVRGMEISGAKSNVTEITLQTVLDKLQLSHDSFMDLCILLGCDYTGTMPGIGPKRALQLIQKHKSIEKILEVLKIQAPHGFDYIKARKAFKEHLVNKNTGRPLLRKLTGEDYVKLKDYLIDIHGLDEKKVVNGIAKLQKIK
jgi:flap endonuclease-1